MLTGKDRFKMPGVTQNIRRERVQMASDGELLLFGTRRHESHDASNSFPNIDRFKLDRRHAALQINHRQHTINHRIKARYRSTEQAKLPFLLVSLCIAGNKAGNT